MCQRLESFYCIQNCWEDCPTREQETKEKLHWLRPTGPMLFLYLFNHTVIPWRRRHCYLLLTEGEKTHRSQTICSGSQLVTGKEFPAALPQPHLALLSYFWGTFAIWNCFALSAEPMGKSRGLKFHLVIIEGRNLKKETIKYTQCLHSCHNASSIIGWHLKLHKAPRST